MPQQIGDGVLVAACDEGCKRKRYTKQKRPGEAAAHSIILGAVVAGLQVTRRSGNLSITWARSEALMLAQQAISSIVRPQPRHKPIRASRVQRLTQGGSIIVLHEATITSAERKAIARLSQCCDALGAGTEQRSAAEPALCSGLRSASLSDTIDGALSGIGDIATTSIPVETQ